MRVEFTGRNIDISSKFEQHAEKRLGKLGRLTERIDWVRVVVAEQRGRVSVEITADHDGTPIRSEVKGPDDRTSFDQALDKLERQLGKFRAKLRRRKRDSLRHAPVEELAEVPDEDDEDETDEPQILRTKAINIKPMSSEEAAMQMELLGHNFFLFRNADTELVSVVYKREHDGYGLLECET
ncbi:MAG TPA: ribosome-associated translation inhibitor RaiA [Armatimonadota bacterium]|nr:ribosome-associated translation inhibitor RaiA [Armatimonadota bacterium]